MAARIAAGPDLCQENREADTPPRLLVVAAPEGAVGCSNHLTNYVTVT